MSTEPVLTSAPDNSPSHDGLADYGLADDSLSCDGLFSDPPGPWRPYDPETPSIHDILGDSCETGISTSSSSPELEYDDDDANFYHSMYDDTDPSARKRVPRRCRRTWAKLRYALCTCSPVTVGVWTALATAGVTCPLTAWVTATLVLANCSSTP
jgi:hypothetical protein